MWAPWRARRSLPWRSRSPTPPSASTRCTRSRSRSSRALRAYRYHTHTGHFVVRRADDWREAVRVTLSVERARFVLVFVLSAAPGVRSMRATPPEPLFVLTSYSFSYRISQVKSVHIPNALFSLPLLLQLRHQHNCLFSHETAPEISHRSSCDQSHLAISFSMYSHLLRADTALTHTIIQSI